VWGKWNMRYRKGSGGPILNVDDPNNPTRNLVGSKAWKLVPLPTPPPVQATPPPP
jgi:hypothetical protein